MCFGRAIWLGRSLSETRCNVIAVRLLTIAVLQPIVSPVLSISCRLITPYIRPFWFKNDGTVVTLARTAFDASCAAMMTQFLYKPSCSLRLGVAAVGRNFACANCAIWCDDARRLCVQQWFGSGDECERLSFERRGTVLCADPPALVGAAVANCCSLRAGCCRTVCMGWCKTSGKVRAVRDSNCVVDLRRRVHTAM
jgi:hypothetical protein